MADQPQSKPASSSTTGRTAPKGKPDPSELRGRRIGRILIKMGKVTREQVHEALDLQQQRKRLPLGQLLIELGYVTAADINAALAAQAGMEQLNLDNLELQPETVNVLPAETARVYGVIPIKYDDTNKSITIAMKSADNFRAIDDLRLLMGFRQVKTVVADPDQIDDYINKYYGGDDESIAGLISQMGSTLTELEGRGESIDLETLIAAADDNMVKRLVNLVLLQAIKDKASDIHFEPFEYEFKMRYRVDGVLYEMIPPPRHLAMAITSRLKVMANLDISERRLPQDGRIELLVQDQQVDLRVAVLPTIFGESVVMRVLDRSNVQLELDRIGLRADDLDRFRQLMHKPNGIVVVTGPTGSGKTTTLYAALNEMNDIETKILTCEDPVEYDIDGLVQVQVNVDQGLTFAKALRSFLRQDPDIILVGEMRDLETAQIAVQAALTGHLVFSTLHTNDAPSSIARLLDLGLEPFLVTATLEGIVAQRLVRKVCTRCKEEYVPTEEQLMELQMTPEDIQGRTFFRGRGCEACNHTGYRGRLAIFEIMVLDDEIRELIMDNASTNVLRNESKKRGMRTLRESGLLAIFEGLTTIDEVVRETVLDEE
ncbi:Flp pilus assembly complex ATPase component TadA [Planctomycetales bacterium ZRK34]|nr:Flp pilus assembly complex ATPase component TadA [Planctomycetales bacterium ZRK34]